MAKNNQVAVIADNPYASIDSKLVTLQMIGAEICGLLTKGKIRRYSTYTQSDIDQLNQAVERKSTRTLISNRAIK